MRTGGDNRRANHVAQHSAPATAPRPEAATDTSASGFAVLERISSRTNAWVEQWMPDAFIFALGGTLIVAVAAFAVDPAMRAAPLKIVDAWGNGFWSLIRFTLQMAMMIVSGYVLATAPAVFRFIQRVAAMPRTGKGAVALVGLFSMLSSLLNWGFSVIFGAVLAREVARRLPKADYRALAAASCTGLGTVWAQGLSGSAALQMASAGSMPPALVKLVGVIPLTQTIFRWESALVVLVELVVVTCVWWLIAPGPGRARSAAQLGIDLGASAAPALPPPERRGERLEHSPLLILPVVAFGFVFLARSMIARSSSFASVVTAFDFDTINLFLLMFGALLHWTPASLMRAVKDGTPAAAGVLLQYPFYAGIFGIMTGTQLSAAIAHVFVRVSSAALYPAMIFTYSAVLGVFVPSGGGKWVIEAPYVLESARLLNVSAGWMVVTYDFGEAVANLVQPFWMLPILGIMNLRARDIMGYTYLVAIVLFPLALLLVSLLRPSV
jgi:short-chain fatty acids transporter